MLRPSTVRDDSTILELYRNGVHPKEIKTKLCLANTMRVYDAIRREKEFPKLSKIISLHKITQ